MRDGDGTCSTVISLVCIRDVEGSAEGIRGPPEVATILEYFIVPLSKVVWKSVIKLGRNGLVGEAIDSLHCMHLFDLLLLDSALLNKLQPADG